MLKKQRTDLPLYNIVDLCQVPDVAAIWKEYAVGVQGPGTALRGLEDKYGSKWRRVPALRVKWCRRKPIHDALERLQHEDGLTPDQAVANLQMRLNALPRSNGHPPWAALVAQLRRAA